MFFNPLTFLFMLLFFVFILFFFFMVQFNVITLAFTKIGIPPHYIFLALIATLVGSFINIPVRKLPQKSITSERTVSFFGFKYVVPGSESNATIVCVNVGGAMIPALISLYLLWKTGLYLQGLAGIVFMTLVCYRLAKPIQGVGIALPFFVPPALATLFSVVVAYHNAPVIAYVSGTLGTLIGADLLNLKKITNLGAPVVSIGGAGTFDGIFLTGIVAVLLSALLT